MTGAEKRRSREGTGLEESFLNSNLSSAFLRESTSSLPPIFRANGMWNGGFIDCLTVKVNVSFSKLPLQSSTGVPATSYQRLNCDRSTPEASCIACTKSSQVTA